MALSSVNHDGSEPQPGEDATERRLELPEVVVKFKVVTVPEYEAT